MMETARESYERLSRVRDDYLKRAKQNAELTVTHLFASYQTTAGQELEQPWSSFGSRAVNSLANKLLLALFPVSTPFFRLLPADDVQQILEGAGVDESDFATALNDVTRGVLEEMSTSATRVKLDDVMKHLIVSGNALLHDDGEVERVFHLNTYVTQRDARGRLRLLVVREMVPRADLSAEQQKMAEHLVSDTMAADTPRPHPSEPKSDDVEVWTVVRWDAESKRYLEHQEIGSQKIEGSEHKHTKDDMPWLPLRMIAVDGEHFGRSFVELYLGDLISLNGLARAVKEGAGVVSKINILVDTSTGRTKLKDVAEAENCEVKPGHADDVTVVQANKLPDLSFAQAAADNIEQRLGAAFLLTNSIQRNAERVTAEEIRILANDLNDNLGGVYALLTVTLQKPLVRLLLKRQKIQSDLLKNTRILITSGLDAIGKGHDFENHRQLVIALREGGFDPREIIKGTVYARRVTNFLGIDPDVIYTEEELATLRQQQTTAAIAEKSAPAVASRVADNIATN